MNNNSIVRRIIEMDKEARRLTDEARKRRTGSASAIGNKKHEVSENYLAMARRRIDDIRSSEMKDAQEQWEKMEEQCSRTAQKLEDLYASKQKQWVGSIVERVLSEEE